MYTNEEIEIMLWDHIDGTAANAVRETVQQMIATDKVWKERYEQLLHLHNELQHSMETEQPSMRFTKNVMEAIAPSAVIIAKPARSYVNKWVVRSIAAFFIITLGVVVVAAMRSIGRDIDFSGNESVFPAFLKNISIGQIINSNTVMLTITASSVAALIFLDTYRRTRHVKNEK